MTRQEFINRTGFYPSYDLYTAIENAYIEFDGDKDEFCKAYRENTDGIAGKIAEKANIGIRKKLEDNEQLIDRMIADIDDLKAEIADRDTVVADLEKQLDREFEWKPCNFIGTAMSQADYNKLINYHFTIDMTDEEASAFISNEFGFTENRIHIIHKVETYDVNKYNRLRVAERYDRVPVYYSTDWNYIRFNVAGIEYECVNGHIRLYCR